MIPRIAAVGTSFSPLPCHAWHGYGVTNAHRVLHPMDMGLLDPMSDGRRRASALPYRCFPAGRRHLRHPRPTAYPSVPFSPKKLSDTAPASLCGDYMRVFGREEIYRTGVEREILVPEYGYYDFQNPLYMDSRQLQITRIAAAGTSFSPLPCHIWHGLLPLASR
jgi:hypothetical protein